MRANASDDGSDEVDNRDDDNENSDRDVDVEDDDDGEDDAPTIEMSNETSNAVSQASDTDGEQDELLGVDECEGPVHNDIPAPSQCDELEEASPTVEHVATDMDAATEDEPLMEDSCGGDERDAGEADDEYVDQVMTDISGLEVVAPEDATEESMDRSSDDEALEVVDEEFRAILEARQRIEADEASRLETRQELQNYVSSLAARIDENGQQLVQFPKNFQRIVALMTAADLQESDERSKTPGPTQKSWSEVLIQTSLFKQQAYVRCQVAVCVCLELKWIDVYTVWTIAGPTR